MTPAPETSDFVPEHLPSSVVTVENAMLLVQSDLGLRQLTAADRFVPSYAAVRQRMESDASFRQALEQESAALLDGNVTAQADKVRNLLAGKPIKSDREFTWIPSNGGGNAGTLEEK